MGKKTGAVLVGIGVFILIVAAMSRFYVYNKLAVVPLDFTSTEVSVGPDATFLSAADGPKEFTASDGISLIATRHTVGQVKDSEKLNDETGKNLSIWETFEYVVSSKHPVVTKKYPALKATYDRVVFDRHTGEVYTCAPAQAKLCDEKTGSSVVKYDGSNPASSTILYSTDPDYTGAFTHYEGQYFKLPFNAQKTTYQWWDGVINKATDLKYQGESSVKGLSTYTYVQKIPPTDVGTITVPGELTTIGTVGPLKTREVYSNTRTLYIEPETGVIIRGVEQQNLVLQYKGEDVLTATHVTIGYNDKTQQQKKDKYGPLALQLKIVRVWLPIVGLVLGLILLGLGIFLVLRARREPESTPPTGSRLDSPTDSPTDAREGSPAGTKVGTAAAAAVDGKAGPKADAEPAATPTKVGPKSASPAGVNPGPNGRPTKPTPTSPTSSSDA